MPQVELGTAVVLDAKNMAVGQVTKIGGLLCVVDRIEGQNVTVRAMGRWERFVYRIKSIFRKIF